MFYSRKNSQNRFILLHCKVVKQIKTSIRQMIGHKGKMIINYKTLGKWPRDVEHILVIWQGLHYAEEI